jgi:hypothetical protein
MLGQACRYAFKDLKVIQYPSNLQDCWLYGGPKATSHFWAPPRSRKAPACQRDLDRAHAMPYTHSYRLNVTFGSNGIGKTA